MKLHRINRLMLEKYGTLLNDLDLAESTLPKGLEEILDRGFTEVDGCILLTYRCERAGVTGDDTVCDKIGAERFYNHTHINCYAEDDTIMVGIAFLSRIASMLAAKFPKYQFRADLSENIEEVGAVVCFYRLREGELWINGDGDIEGFKRECLCEFDL
jgi:hypothetical protein